MTTPYVDPVALAYSIIEEKAIHHNSARWLQKLLDEKLMGLPTKSPDCITATDLGNIARGKPIPDTLRDHTFGCRNCRAALNLWHGYVRERQNQGV